MLCLIRAAKIMRRRTISRDGAPSASLPAVSRFFLCQRAFTLRCVDLPSADFEAREADFGALTPPVARDSRCAQASRLLPPSPFTARSVLSSAFTLKVIAAFCDLMLPPRGGVARYCVSSRVSARRKIIACSVDFVPLAVSIADSSARRRRSSAASMRRLPDNIIKFRFAALAWRLVKLRMAFLSFSEQPYEPSSGICQRCCSRN